MSAGPAARDALYVEAAAWVVRLHGPSRSTELEAGLRRWLSESPGHRHAFELATETWNSTGRIADHEVGRLRRWLESRPADGIHAARHQLAKALPTSA